MARRRDFVVRYELPDEEGWQVATAWPYVMRSRLPAEVWVGDRHVCTFVPEGDDNRFWQVLPPIDPALLPDS